MDVRFVWSNLQFPSVAPGSPGPDSNHPGGLNAAFCDGSVQFLSETMGRQMLDAMITKAGAEAVGAY